MFHPVYTLISKNPFYQRRLSRTRITHYFDPGSEFKKIIMCKIAHIFLMIFETKANKHFINIQFNLETEGTYKYLNFSTPSCILQYRFIEKAAASECLMCLL